MADPLVSSYPASEGWGTSPRHPTSLSPPPPSDTAASFSRDPKIFGMPSPSLTSPPTAGLDNSRAFPAPSQQPPAPYIKVRISGLERNRKDLLIRFDASTNLPNFRTTLYRNMQRSYVEFQLFAEQIAYTNPQTIVPALPLPNTSAVTDEEDDRLVRIALQRWLTRVCEDPVLQKDDELRSFLESDFGYTPTPRHAATSSSPFSYSTTHSRLPSTTSRVALPSAITRVFKRGPPDEDEDLAAAKGELEKLEDRWGGTAAAVGKVGVARRAIAAAEADTGAKLISLATVEPNPELSSAMRKVGRGFESLAGIAHAQAVSDNIVLSDSLGYQALNARAAKETLLHRIQVLEDAQNASKTAINKRRTVERLKGSSNISTQKVDDAIAEMQDAQDLDNLLTQRVQAISVNLRSALQRHSRQAHEDAANVLLEFARTKIMYERQTLKELEVLRPELRSVGIKAAPRSQPTTNGRQPTPTSTADGASFVPPQPPATFPAPPPMAPAAPPPPPMSQSLYLPGQAQYNAPQPRLQPSAQPQYRPPYAPAPPTGPPTGPPPGSHPMAQSMFLPPSARPPGGPPVYGTQRRKLDDRAAAKSLANMF